MLAGMATPHRNPDTDPAKTNPRDGRQDPTNDRPGTRAPAQPNTPHTPQPATERGNPQDGIIHNPDAPR